MGHGTKHCGGGGGGGFERGDGQQGWVASRIALLLLTSSRKGIVEGNVADPGSGAFLTPGIQNTLGNIDDSTLRGLIKNIYSYLRRKARHNLCTKIKNANKKV